MSAPDATASAARPAGRLSWRVVGATFVTLGLVYGFWYAYASFLVAFLREFGWSRTVVAGVFSTLVLVHGATGPPLGWLVDRLGPRRLIGAGGAILGAGLLVSAQATRAWHLYAGIGVVAGAGIACAGWLPSVALVRGWFPARVGTAIGIASAGIGVGIFALVPVVQLLIDHVGWRWALRVLAVAVMAWIIPAAIWLVRDPPRRGGGDGAVPARPEAGAAATHWTLAAALRSWKFWGVAGVFFAGSMATQMLLVHQVVYLMDHGVAGLRAATVVGLVGLASVAGKAGWGTMSDRAGRELAYTLAFACVLASIGVLVLSGRAPASVLPYVYAVLIGVGYAATAPLTPAVASDLFGGPRFAMIFGMLHMANSVGGALGPWLAGRLFDATGTYGLALGVAAAMAVLAPTVLWFVAPRRANPPPGAWRS